MQNTLIEHSMRTVIAFEFLAKPYITAAVS